MIILEILLIVICIAVLIKIYLPKFIDCRIESYQNDLIEKQCEEVQNMYSQTRGWRHDYRHHIQTMKAYLEMGKVEELERYLNELDKDLTTVDTVIKTGNTKIDAVLNSKISLAKNKKIKVNAKAVVPKELNVSEIDLSVIIGNLMDNAMESCAEIKEPDQRFIRIYIDVLKGQLYLYVMNSVGNTLKKQGNRYLSTKGIKHGFGLIRLDNVVKKYSGYINRQDETDVFVTEIMLPL